MPIPPSKGRDFADRVLRAHLWPGLPSWVSGFSMDFHPSWGVSDFCKDHVDFHRLSQSVQPIRYAEFADEVRRAIDAPGPGRSVRRRVVAVLDVFGKRPRVRETSDLEYLVVHEWFHERLQEGRNYAATLAMLEILDVLCGYAVFHRYLLMSQFVVREGPQGWFPRDFRSSSGWSYPRRRRWEWNDGQPDLPPQPAAKPRPPRAKAAPRPAIRVDRKLSLVTVGKIAYQVTAEGAAFVDVLLREALSDPDRRLSLKTMAARDTLLKSHPDRIRDALPAPVRDLIDIDPRWGHRIKMGNLG